MIVKHARVVDDLLAGQPARDRHHLDPVERPLAADGEAVERAVGVGEVGEVGVEMPGAGRKLLRRGRLVADEMDHVEALRELDQRDVVVEVPGAPTTDAVVDRRRTGHEAEGDARSPPTSSRARGVSGRDGELPGCARQTACSTTSRGILTRPVSSSTSEPAAGERSTRCAAHELHADVLEQSQRRVVNRAHLLVVEQLQPARKALIGGVPLKGELRRRFPRALCSLVACPARHSANLQLGLQFGERYPGTGPGVAPRSSSA